MTAVRSVAFGGCDLGGRWGAVRPDTASTGGRLSWSIHPIGSRGRGRSTANPGCGTFDGGAGEVEADDCRHHPRQ